MPQSFLRYGQNQLQILYVKALPFSFQTYKDTSIGGMTYLRNIVHLPFYLQNSGLRKVPIAQVGFINWKCTYIYLILTLRFRELLVQIRVVRIHPG